MKFLFRTHYPGLFTRRVCRRWFAGNERRTARSETGNREQSRQYSIDWNVAILHEHLAVGCPFRKQAGTRRVASFAPCIQETSENVAGEVRSVTPCFDIDSTASTLHWVTSGEACHERARNAGTCWMGPGCLWGDRFACMGLAPLPVLIVNRRNTGEKVRGKPMLSQGFARREHSF